MNKRTEPSLESGIAELARTLPPPNRLPQTHPHIDMQADVPDLSRLTSEAVMAQYDEAAKSVEALGGAVRQTTADLEAAMADLANSLKLISDAANHIREKGADVQRKIERVNELTKEVRSVCEGFTRKVPS
jgi:ABC-type transporter Mla subunit MlaD